MKELKVDESVLILAGIICFFIALTVSEATENCTSGGIDPSIVERCNDTCKDVGLQAMSYDPPYCICGGTGSTRKVKIDE